MGAQAVTAVGAKVAVLVFLALTFQQAVLEDLRVGGVQPDVMLLVAVAGGVAGGAERGALLGFFSGLVADLFLPTPLGLSALAYSLVGYLVGSVQTAIIRSVWWIPVATAFVGSAVGVVLYGLLGAMIGRPHFVQLHLLLTAGVVAAVNAVLAVPFVRVLRWGFAGAPEAYGR